MNLKLVTEPDENVVSLSDAKAHLRVDMDIDDDLITIYLHAATVMCEEIARRTFIHSTYDLYLDKWWDEKGLKFPLPPLSEVVDVKYTTENDSEISLDPSMYIVDTASEPGRIWWASGVSAPSASLKPISGIKIRFIAGYGDAYNVPATYKAAVLLVLAHLYENREAVGYQAASKLPMGAESLLMMNRGYR